MSKRDRTDRRTQARSESQRVAGGRTPAPAGAEDRDRDGDDSPCPSGADAERVLFRFEGCERFVEGCVVESIPIGGFGTDLDDMLTIYVDGYGRYKRKRSKTLPA